MFDRFRGSGSAAITLPPIDNGDAGDEARAVYERMAEAMPFNPRARLGV